MQTRAPSALAMFAGLAFTGSASAQLWDGGGANDNWSTANNWNPNGVPVNDGTANIGFRGSVRLTPVVNALIDVRSITFASPAGSFDINPGVNRFFLLIGSGGVTNNDASPQTISNPTRLTASQTWRAASGDLVIGSVDGQGNALTIGGGFNTTIARHTGSSSSLIKTGTGTLILTGNSTSDGGITITAGSVSIDADARLGGNDVVINGGTLAPTANLTTARNITLAGVGATLNAAGLQLALNGGFLTVDAGAVTSASGFLGLDLPSDGGAVINGGGSSWTMTGGFAVGYQDRGTLRIANGGSVSNGIGHLGSLPGSVGVATVTGPGSTWTSSGFLGVGYSGAGTLRIEPGGGVSADSSFVGTEPGSSGRVDVAGGAWNVNGSPVIGEHGVGMLDISGGGTVTCGGAFIGRYGDGEGHATVTGSGSTWTTAGALTVAGSGGGSLFVGNGGVVTSVGCMVGGNAGAGGSLVVLGARLFSGDLSVGFAGVGTMDVGPDGAVTSAGGSIAGLPTADGSAANVQGPNATWTLSGDLSVGDGGAGTLTVREGGRVVDVHGMVGRLLGGRGTAVVSGAGSVWSGDNLAVGYLSGTGSLSVQNGGLVVCQNGSIGNSSGVGVATVAGSGSTWDIPGALSVGFMGTGTLVLDQGGRMSTALLSLGFGTGSSATATIDGAGSSWAIGFALQMCDGGATGTLNILGGTVTVAGDITDGGAGVSSLTLDGGTLDMQNHAIGSAAPNRIDNLAFRGGTLRNVAGINGGAGLSKTGTGTLILNTANTYTGTTTVAGGVLEVSNAGGSATGPGSVAVGAGATMRGVGRIAGPVQSGGTVAPGASAGILRLAGAYTQTAGGSLDIEIGGPAAGSQYDRLAVTGAAALNGTLNVTLVNGFTPAPGGVFDILTASPRSGSFSTVNLPPLSSGVWSVEYLATGVRLRVTGCPADFNGDGFLDFFDYDDYVTCFETGACPPGRTADFNGDNFADFFDYDDFVNAFETGC